MKKGLLHDVFKALLAGSLLAAACFVLSWACGRLFGSRGMLSGLEAAKDALCVLTAVQLFLLAGALLQKGKRPASFRAEENGWQRRFRVLGPRAVLLCFALAAAAFAALADALLRAAG